MRILFLDDMLERFKTFQQNNAGVAVDWVQSADAAIGSLKHNDYKYDVIFLDHDLSVEHYSSDARCYEHSGMDVVDNLVMHADKLGNVTVFVHSLNVSRRPEMVMRLIDAGIRAVDMPFAWTLVRFKHPLHIAD